MGLLGRRNRYDHRTPRGVERAATGKLYRSVSTVAMIGIFVAISILILAMFGYLQFSATLFGWVFTIAVLCAGTISTLPWVKNLEDRKYKTASIVFLCMVGVSVILWIICVWIAISIYYSIKYMTITETQAIFSINFIKITIIVSLQFLIATFIGRVILKYKKTYIPFQVITYASYLFFDFYITFALLCISFNMHNPDIVAISPSINLLGGRLMLTLLVLAIAYMSISSAILKAVETRKTKYAMESLVEEQDEKYLRTQMQAAAQKTNEEKLAELKSLFDKNLISEEEYKQKRAELLKNM